MKKGVFVLCLAICVLFTLSSICASDLNDTIVASDDNQIELSQDSIDDKVIEEDNLKSSEIDEILTSSPKTFSDLNTTINSNDDSDVYLDSNYRFELGCEDSFKDGVTINRAVTIHGNGYTIDGNNAARIFTVTNSDVIFKEIIFVNGNSSNGGAINGKCTAVNCSFNSNSAENGGAVYSEYELKISNCYFFNNSASYGGAIYGNIIKSTIDGDFKGNTADCGGAIYGNIIKSTFNGDFTENIANIGGAIYGNITDSIFNGDFTENIANTGGAIYGNITDSIFNGDFINNAAISVPLTMSDVLGADDNDVLNFVPAIGGAGGGIYGNVAGSTLNTNFVMNTANVGAVIAGNVEKSVFTGEISKNTASEGIIISGNVIKSIFTGDIEDILEIDSEISGDWIDSFIKKFLNEKEREELERLQNLTKESEFEIKSDLHIYVDGAATVNPNEISVLYHFDIMNFIMDQTLDYDISTLKDISNPLDGPLGTIFDKMLDDFLHDVLKDSPETDFTGSTAYLTMEIKTLNNLKDAIQIANAFGLLFKDKYFKVVKQFTLEELCVKIAPGVYRGDKNKGLEIVTNYTLMKDGEGDVIIDAENNGNILTVKEPQITINGLTFMHASDSAIIFEQGLSDSVINANFIDNSKNHKIYDTYTDNSGGAAFYSKGDIKRSVIGGIFENNVMGQGNGGAIYVKGNVENCTFNGSYTNNSLGTGPGGVMFCDNITNSIFSGDFIGNRAINYHGGVICADDVVESIFSGNFINNVGYGGYSAGVMRCGNIINSVFSGYFRNNSGTAEGGVISSYDISNSIFDGVFIDNSVIPSVNRGGGALCAYNILNSTINGTFINNSAYYSVNNEDYAGNGGAIFCLGISDSSISGYFNDNVASYGGAIFCKGEIHDSIFNATFKGNLLNLTGESSYGGAIYADTINRCNFYGDYIDNKATYGGAIYVDDIDYCTFSAHYSGNAATEGNVLWTRWFYSHAGAGITRHNSANIPDSDVYDKRIRWAQTHGTSMLSCSEPMDNLLATSPNNIYVDGSASPDGDGSLYNPFNNLKSAINQSTDGDTIYIYPGTYAGDNNTGLTINKNLNLIKIGNDEVIFDAQNNGRIFTVSTTSLNIVGLTFTNATDSAITFSTDIVSSIIDANFVNNRNKAALYVTGRAINSIFIGDYINNTAINDGAAMHADSFILCELNANFINNAAANGGAIAGNIISSTINGNFTGNTAANGAAIAGNVMKSVVNAKFTNNVANGNGGAIYGNVSSTNFTSALISNNAAGGGVIYGSVSSCIFRNDIINNHATDGGMIYGSVSSSYFNCNFMNNSACRGSILYCDGDVSKSVFNGKYTNNSADEDCGVLFYATGNVMDTSFLGEIFVSNLTNVPDLVYSAADSPINCIFNNYTKEPDIPQPIDEKDINIPPLDGATGKSVTVKLPGDAKGTITLNIGGKNYKFNVVNGVANVQVPNLANGAYPYSITYSGDDHYASFTKTGSLTINNSPQNTKPTTKKTTKTTLTLKKVKVKKSAKKLVITATLKINGKAAKGKTIKFKFNKKTYKAKTNKKGVAKITIKKAVLKKLKVGKKVKYQASYGKTTKKATVKVKK